MYESCLLIENDGNDDNCYHDDDDDNSHNDDDDGNHDGDDDYHNKVHTRACLSVCEYGAIVAQKSISDERLDHGIVDVLLQMG